MIRDAVTSFGGGDGADDMELIFACALCMLVVVVGKWESPRSARNRRRTRSPRCLLPFIFKQFAILLLLFSAFE